MGSRTAPRARRSRGRADGRPATVRGACMRPGCTSDRGRARGRARGRRRSCVSSGSRSTRPRSTGSTRPTSVARPGLTNCGGSTPTGRRTALCRIAPSERTGRGCGPSRPRLRGLRAASALACSRRPRRRAAQPSGSPARDEHSRCSGRARGQERRRSPAAQRSVLTSAQWVCGEDTRRLPPRSGDATETPSGTSLVTRSRATCALVTSCRGFAVREIWLPGVPPL